MEALVAARKMASLISCYSFTSIILLPCNSLYNDMEKTDDGFSLDTPNTLPVSSHLFLK